MYGVIAPNFVGYREVKVEDEGDGNDGAKNQGDYEVNVLGFDVRQD